MMMPLNKVPRKSPGEKPAQAARAKTDIWDLRLYVANHSPRCARALVHLKSFCAARLNGRYRIEIIDLLRHPEIARRDQIVAIPTLVRRKPLPIRTVIGDLSSTERMLARLDLLPSV